MHNSKLFLILSRALAVIRPRDLVNSSNNQLYKLFAVQSSGNIQINFGSYKNRIEFEDASQRQAFLKKLNDIKGVSIPEDAVIRFPSIPLIMLKDEYELKQFLETYEWFLDVIK